MYNPPRAPLRRVREFLAPPSGGLDKKAAAAAAFERTTIVKTSSAPADKPYRWRPRAERRKKLCFDGARMRTKGATAAISIENADDDKQKPKTRKTSR